MAAKEGTCIVTLNITVVVKTKTGHQPGNQIEEDIVKITLHMA